MRIFANTKEAYEEILRDLMKFGRIVHSKTQQDKDVSNDPNYITKEIIGYTFSVIDCSDMFQTCKDPEWCKEEFYERIHQGNRPINPGVAWKMREEYWEKYIREDGTLHYTYNERMGKYIKYIKDNLRSNKDTRRAVLSIWDQQLDGPNINNLHRVSCSMYYQLFIREDKLILEYVMRSSDFFEHFTNDFTLATLFKQYIAQTLGIEPGETIMHIGSLHTYKKDWHHFEDKIY